MKSVKTMLTSSLSLLILYLVVILTILIFVEMQPVQAGPMSQSMVTAAGHNVQYLKLTDAPSQRDITKQRLAPWEVTP